MRKAISISLLGTFGLLALGCGGEPVGTGAAEPAEAPAALAPAEDAATVAPEAVATTAADGPALGFDFAGFAGKVRGIDELGRKHGGTGCVSPIVPVGISATDPGTSAREAVAAMVGHPRAEIVKGKVECTGSCNKALIDRLAAADRAFSFILVDLASAVTRQSSLPSELTLWSDAHATPAITLHGAREGHVFGLAYFFDRRDCR